MSLTNKHLVVAAAFTFGSVTAWRAYFVSPDQILDGAIAQAFAVFMVALIPAQYWALRFAVIAGRQQQDVDRSFQLSAAFAFAAPIIGLVPAFATGQLWPLIAAEVLGAIGSIGPLSMLRTLSEVE